MTKVAPHEAPKLITRGKLTFDEPVVLYRVVSHRPGKKTIRISQPSNSIFFVRRPPNKNLQEKAGRVERDMMGGWGLGFRVSGALVFKAHRLLYHSTRGFGFRVSGFGCTSSAPNARYSRKNSSERGGSIPSTCGGDARHL